MDSSVGKVSLGAHLRFPCVRCDGAVVEGKPAALAAVAAGVLAQHVAVPVGVELDRTKVMQSVMTGWSRQLLLEGRTTPPAFGGPIVISARDRWHLDPDEVEVFDRGLVIDGARRLEATLDQTPELVLPMIVVLGLNPQEELELRRTMQVGPSSTRVEVRERFDTTAPRLKVSDDWTAVTLLSDPFIVVTARGYAPAILVQREGCPHPEHLLAGAKSLAVELEDLRPLGGRLVGLRLELRKQSPAPTAPYEVRACR